MALFVPAPLEPEWQPLLEQAVPRLVHPSALAMMVSRLSRRYLGEEVELARSDELVARTRFFFARDIAKVALPIAELGLAGALADRPLRVLDLGAGVGATSAGLLRTLADPRLGGSHRVDALHLVDRDADVLGVARTLLVEAAKRQLLPAPSRIETRVGDLTAPTSFATSEPYDLVLVGSALVETTRTHGDESTRGTHMASTLAAIIGAAPLAADGSLVVIEPATRPETRALHHARAALIARGFGIFAPCTHLGSCPMLARERDWCHEDLPANLPAWLEPVAREAGLRWEGLTFTELVVRRDRRNLSGLGERGMEGWIPTRVVSTPRETKGKTEAFASGPFRPDVTGARLMQLDREVKKAPDGVQLASLSRGDVIVLDPRVSETADGTHPVRVSPAAIQRVTANRSR